MGNITTLIGRKEIEHGVRCLGSLRRYCGGSPTLQLFDDGTLSDGDIEVLRSSIPECVVILRTARERVIQERLAAFPRCSRFRLENPLAQKLFDIMLWPEGAEPIFYCDSDVLFFRPFEDPRSLLTAGIDAMFMTDDAFAYSLYPWQLLGAGGVSVARLINTGMIVAKRSVLDLSFLEDVLADDGVWRKFTKTPCWAEQSCWAMLAARVNAKLFDSEQIRLVRAHDTDRIEESIVGLHCISSLRHKLQILPEGAAVTGERVMVGAIDCVRLGVTEAFLTIIARSVRRFQSVDQP